MSSQSCDLSAEIYGVYQSSNKHVKKFFCEETQSLQRFCWPCGCSLRLGCRAAASVDNGATVCERGQLTLQLQHFPSKAELPSPGLSVWTAGKYLLLTFAIELSVRKSVKRRFIHFFTAWKWKYSAKFLKSDILMVYLMFEKLVNGASNFCSN